MGKLQICGVLLSNDKSVFWSISTLGRRPGGEFVVCKTYKLYRNGLVLGSSGPMLMGSAGSGGGVWTESKGCFLGGVFFATKVLCEGGCLLASTPQ